MVWFAVSLRLLEHHDGADRNDQVIDLNRLEHETRGLSSGEITLGPTPEDLVAIAGVGRVTARVLAEHGFAEIRTVAVAGISDLAGVPWIRVIPSTDLDTLWPSSTVAGANTSLRPRTQAWTSLGRIEASARSPKVGSMWLRRCASICSAVVGRWTWAACQLRA